MQTLQIFSIAFGLWNQNDYAVLNIYDQTIPFSDIQFLACHLGNRNLILRTDFDRGGGHRISLLGKIANLLSILPHPPRSGSRPHPRSNSTPPPLPISADGLSLGVFILAK